MTLPSTFKNLFGFRRYKNSNIFLLLLAFPLALNAMEEKKESQPLKMACVSIALSGADHEKPDNKEVIISYTQEGKIVSPAYHQLEQKVATGAYSAAISLSKEINNNGIKVAYIFFDGKESMHDAEGRIHFDVEPHTFTYYQEAEKPTEEKTVLARLVIAAKTLNNNDKK